MTHVKASDDFRTKIPGTSKGSTRSHQKPFQKKTFGASWGAVCVWKECFKKMRKRKTIYINNITFKS